MPGALDRPGRRGLDPSGAGGSSDPTVGGDLEAELIGAYLARQRTLRGITLQELARRTRIPLRSLERLEAGAFDHKPDGFARGFVRTVAQAVGCDPDDAVARMLAEPPVAPRPGLPDLRRLGLAALLVGAALATVFGCWSLLRGLGGGQAEPPVVLRAAPLAVRHDAVRSLAIEEGVVRADRESRARPLVPPTPPPAQTQDPPDPAEAASE